MTPDEALNKAMDLLLSKEYEPIIVKALTNANDISAGAAILVYPIIFRMMQETDIPDEELLGNEQGDGIAIHLLAEVFDIAGKAGIVEDGEDEPPEEARAMAEKAVQILGDLLSKGTGAMNDAAQQGQNEPQQPPAPQQAQPQQPPAPQSRSLLGAVQ